MRSSGHRFRALGGAALLVAATAAAEPVGGFGCWSFGVGVAGGVLLGAITAVATAVVEAVYRTKRPSDAGVLVCGVLGAAALLVGCLAARQPGLHGIGALLALLVAPPLVVCALQRFAPSVRLALGWALFAAAAWLVANAEFARATACAADGAGLAAGSALAVLGLWTLVHLANRLAAAPAPGAARPGGATGSAASGPRAPTVGARVRSEIASIRADVMSVERRALVAVAAFALVFFALGGVFELGYARWWRALLGVEDVVRALLAFGPVDVSSTWWSLRGAFWSAFLGAGVLALVSYAGGFDAGRWARARLAVVVLLALVAFGAWEIDRRRSDIEAAEQAASGRW